MRIKMRLGEGRIRDEKVVFNWWKLIGDIFVYIGKYEEKSLSSASVLVQKAVKAMRVETAASELAASAL